ncbi:MAG: SoxR reducing system RseC family protein [Nitrospirae bacterium]|nr:SoxR reducing system RseC family protein [Nitrospirota bacterium]
MIEETGVVTHTEGDKAKVLVQRKSDCEACASAGVCEPAQGSMQIEALNPVHASVGDKVKVSMKPGVYLRGTMIVYAIPLIALIAGAILGKNIGEAYFKEYNSDIAAAILGFISLLISLIIIKIWSRGIETKAEYSPVIEEIIRE